MATSTSRTAASFRLFRFYGVLISVFWLGLLPLTSQAEQTRSTEEFRLKAAFIYNFSQFIEWPSSAFAQPSSPLTICVLGIDPFGESLLALQKRTYQGHPIVVNHPPTITSARDCHILYVDDLGNTVGGRDIGETLGDAPVLTISSRSDAMESGIGIGFVEQSDKIRWTLNLDAVRRAQLKVSAKLIEIAVAVVGETGR